MTYPNKAPGFKWNRWMTILAFIVAALIIIMAFSPYAIVPAGHTGVIVTMGSVSENVLSPGLHLKLPWQNIIMIDNRAQKAPLVTQAFSSDIQQVDVTLSVNYSVDKETSHNLYKNVGTEFYSTVMLPRIMENVKAMFSKYTAENLVAARETLSRQIKDLLAVELKAYGIEVLSVAIENIDFTDAFTDAVEAKQVAEQTKLKTEIEQAEKLMVERTSAERAIIAANAEADIAKIDAEAKAYAKRMQAEAEAEANRLIAQSVTQDLISYVQANNWDGALPKFFAGEGNGVLPILDLGAE